MAVTSRGYRAALVIVLRLGGTLLLLAFFAIFLPPATMASVHRSLGLGSFPAAPVTDYLARSIAALYGFHGVLLWIVSTDLDRFRPLVLYVGLMNVVFGLLLTGIDLFAGLPLWWTLGEGPPVILTGAVILVLYRRI